MANEYTVSEGAALEDVVRAAYSKATELAFQPNLYFAQFAQEKRWDAKRGDPMPGDQVVFTIYNNLAAATSELSDEYSDVTRAPITDVQKTVSLKEYGNVVTVTNKLRATAFDNIDLTAGRVVGANMANSIDLIARAAFDAQTGGAYNSVKSGKDKEHLTDSDTLAAADLRKMYNKLDRANVPKLDGGFYAAILHPDVVFDLRNETGTGTWRAPREYADSDEIYNGEIGEFEGFRIVSSTNAAIEADAGSGAVDVYASYFFGYQAVAYALGAAPALRITGPFDNLGRTLNFGWYALVGFGELRPDALHKFFSASSVGANS
jgi:N4-gp56 family major capsid protein